MLPHGRYEELTLIESVRPRRDAASLSRLETLLASDLDWTELIALALHHQVAPALLTAFGEPSLRPLIPAEILEALRVYGNTVRTRNDYLLGELGEILSALEGEGIGVVPFKGPILTTMLYGDLERRPPGDLDFLVRLRDVTRVCEILVSRGYRDNHATSAPMTAIQHAIYRQSQCEYQFVRDRDGVIAEPHWAYMHRTRGANVDYDGHFARAGWRTIAGITTRVHAPEDLLLLLCLHGAKHQWERLGWIRDVAALLEQRAAFDLDLDAALARSIEQRCRRVLLLGVLLAHELLDASLPSALKNAALTDAAVMHLSRDVKARLFERDRPALNQLAIDRFSFSSHDNVAARMQYVARMLLRPHRVHIELAALPASLAWLYYPMRWGHDYALLPLWTMSRRVRQQIASRGAPVSSAIKSR